MSESRFGYQETNYISIRDLLPWRFHDEIYGSQPGAGLIASIRETGIQKPLIVTETRHLICGYRRLRATKLLALPLVPVRLVAAELSFVRAHFDTPKDDFRATAAIELVELAIFMLQSNINRHKSVEECDREEAWCSVLSTFSDELDQYALALPEVAKLRRKRIDDRNRVLFRQIHERMKAKENAASVQVIDSGGRVRKKTRLQLEHPGFDNTTFVQESPVTIEMQNQGPGPFSRSTLL